MKFSRGSHKIITAGAGGSTTICVLHLYKKPLYVFIFMYKKPLYVYVFIFIQETTIYVYTVYKQHIYFYNNISLEEEVKNSFRL